MDASFHIRKLSNFPNLLDIIFPTWLKRFLASAMSSCSPGAQMLSPTGSRRFRVATIRLVCIEYRSPFLFIFFLSWSETIPWGKVKHQKTRNAQDQLCFMSWIDTNTHNIQQTLIPSTPLQSMCPYLWHLTLGVSDEEGHVVDFILDHKVLLFSLKVLQKDDSMTPLHHSTIILLCCVMVD